MRQRHEKVEDLTTYTGPNLTLLQLAEAIDVPRRTLYYHVEIGALKVVRRGGVIRVLTSEALRYAGLTPAPHTHQSVQSLQTR